MFLISFAKAFCESIRHCESNITSGHGDRWHHNHSNNHSNRRGCGVKSNNVLKGCLSMDDGLPNFFWHRKYNRLGGFRCAQSSPGTLTIFSNDVVRTTKLACRILVPPGQNDSPAGLLSLFLCGDEDQWGLRWFEIAGRGGRFVLFD